MTSVKGNTGELAEENNGLNLQPPSRPHKAISQLSVHCLASQPTRLLRGLIDTTLTALFPVKPALKTCSPANTSVSN